MPVERDMQEQHQLAAEEERAAPLSSEASPTEVRLPRFATAPVALPKRGEEPDTVEPAPAPGGPPISARSQMIQPAMCGLEDSAWPPTTEVAEPGPVAPASEYERQNAMLT
jgi:hypothetical protein